MQVADCFFLSCFCLQQWPCPARPFCKHCGCRTVAHGPWTLDPGQAQHPSRAPQPQVSRTPGRQGSTSVALFQFQSFSVAADFLFTLLQRAATSEQRQTAESPQSTSGGGRWVFTIVQSLCSVQRCAACCFCKFVLRLPLLPERCHSGGGRGAPVQPDM